MENLERRQKLAVILIQKINDSRRRRSRLNEIGVLLSFMSQLEQEKEAALIGMSLLGPSRVMPSRPRREVRNDGWFHCVWNKFSNKRFKQTLRISRETFNYILSHIGHELQRDVVCEEPISPAERLAIALYKFSRGDYNHTISQMCGRGESTVREITLEVAELIVEK